MSLLHMQDTLWFTSASPLPYLMHQEFTHFMLEDIQCVYSFKVRLVGYCDPDSFMIAYAFGDTRDTPDKKWVPANTSVLSEL